MDQLVVECLRCGTTRVARRTVWNRFETPECPRCGYLGWAPTERLSEGDRADLRAKPVERRRLRSVA